MEALILVNGDLHLNQKLFQRAQQAKLVIAADGGARHCESLQRIPDILIGDFDSIPKELLETFTGQGAEKLSFPARKNETDLELAIDYAIKQGASTISFAGMLGGRWDMSLGNIFLLGHEKYKTTRFTILGDSYEAHVLRPGKHSFNREPGEQASLLPLSAEVEHISIQGFEYPLDNAQLQFGTTHGISNIVRESNISVEFAAGVLLVLFSLQGDE